MNITLRQLSIFEMVAKHQSYTRAAEALFLTQPAISMQIKQLEEEVALPLFERVGRSIYLTEAGEELRQYASRILQQLNEAEAVLEELRDGQHGRLKIAVATTASYFALKLLGDFYKRFPGANIVLDVTNRAGLLKHLDDNSSDMVIMGQPPEEIDVEAVAFLDNPLVVIAPPDHAMVGRKAVPAGEIQQETFILREHGSGTRIAMERFFEQQGYSISSVMEMSSNEAINQAVEAGLGLGIMSRHALTAQAGPVILDVEGFPIQREWYLVHRKGKRLTALMQAFKTLVETEARTILTEAKNV